MTHQSSLPDSVRFQDVELSIIDRDGKPWITGRDLARALGYSETDQIGRIFRRNRDEFAPDMSQAVKLTGGRQVAPATTRIFSPRGAHLIAMFARTSRAKAFRKWVLDVLDGLAARTPADVPPPRPRPALPKGQASALDRGTVKAINRRAHDLAQADFRRYRDALEQEAKRRKRRGEPVNVDALALPDPDDDALAGAIVEAARDANTLGLHVAQVRRLLARLLTLRREHPVAAGVLWADIKREVAVIEADLLGREADR